MLPAAGNPTLSLEVAQVSKRSLQSCPQSVLVYPHMIACHWVLWFLFLHPGAADLGLVPVSIYLAQKSHCPEQQSGSSSALPASVRPALGIGDQAPARAGKPAVPPRNRVGD